MRKICWISCLLCVFLTSGTIMCYAQDDLSNWQYSKEITGASLGEYKTCFLDADVYKNAATELSDLRVVDEKGEFVPYYLQSSALGENNQTINYQASKINTFEKDHNTYIDYKIKPIKENADIVANLLLLKVEQKNFAKNIEVLGGYDADNWTSLTHCTIYQVAQDTNVQVILPQTEKYGFYRIVIPNNLEKIQINQMDARLDSSTVTRQSFQKEVALTYDIKQEDTVTSISIQNPNRLKISSIDLNAQGTFDRRYDVFTQEGEELVPVGLNGRIFNVKFKDLNIQNTVIPLDNKPITHTSIIIKLQNKDDRPLTIKSIKGRYTIDKIVFKTPSAKNLLYFGNLEAKKPQYDLEQYKTYIERENQQICTLENLKRYEKTPIPKANSMDFNKIFNIVIVVVSLMLMGLIGWKLSKKNQAT